MDKRIPILLGLIMLVGSVWILLTSNIFVQSLLDRLTDVGYDLQMRTRILTHPHPKLAPIAIIDIDDRSLQVEGRWPWPRGKIAQLVDELHQAGAAVIVFDMFFSEPEADLANTLINQLKQQSLLTTQLETLLKQHANLLNEDALFAKSLSTQSSVLAVSFLPRKQAQNLLPPPLFYLSSIEANQLDIAKAEGYISSIPILQQAAKVGGFINNVADSDGIVRHTPLLMIYKNGVYPSLALQAVVSLLGEKVTISTPTYGESIRLEGLYLGANFIPTNANGQALIPYVGRSYTFPYYAATDVLHSHIPPNVLLGKIVFVGTSATGLGDLQATAIQSPFPGVEIQATIANGLLNNQFSYIPAWTLGANIFLVIVLGLTAIFLFPYLGPRTLAPIIILLPLVLLFVNNLIWESTGLILSFLIPVFLVILIALLNIIYGYLFESKRREHLKQMFGQYVPEKHIDEMLRAHSSFALHGEDREMSVLFADIRDFTHISENMSASELVDLLNTYFTPMTEIIFKYRGTIDKYVGDLLMAFWGAPLKDKSHSAHAIRAALAMQTKLTDLNRKLVHDNWPAIKIGIGINSGMMVVGDMGSRFRLNYTVLGDAVNLASRIEGLTKFYDVGIIVTETTAANQTKFVFRKLDKVKVKGKNEITTIFEVIGLQSDMTGELQTELMLYDHALAAYFAKEWTAAHQMFSELQKIYPDRKLYTIYLDRIQEFQRTPPPDDWDGAYEHVSK
jgi:adenylate cyclase